MILNETFCEYFRTMTDWYELRDEFPRGADRIEVISHVLSRITRTLSKALLRARVPVGLEVEFSDKLRTRATRIVIYHNGKSHFVPVRVRENTICVGQTKRDVLVAQLSGVSELVNAVVDELISLKLDVKFAN